jgi:NADPH-dependent 2,4-dienoyl-CoA reductase/sulfur reductase-like enzyme
LSARKPPTNTRVLEIRDDGVVVEENGTSRTLPAGLVVTAIGSRPNAAPAKKLNGKYPVPAVGDAFAAGKAPDGISAAYKAAMEL